MVQSQRKVHCIQRNSKNSKYARNGTMVKIGNNEIESKAHGRREEGEIWARSKPSAILVTFIAESKSRKAGVTK